MKREQIPRRPNWENKLNEFGLEYCIDDSVPFWTEGACYRFTPEEVDVLEEATQTLHVMCMHAVEHVIATKQYERFHIPPAYIPLIEKSWVEKHPFIFGRFDLSYDGVYPPKMLEYNADTPTTLPEAAVAQWHWLQDHIKAGDLPATADQFNSIHESMIDAWKKVNSEVCIPTPLWFACEYGMNNGQPTNKEDILNLRYMRDVCEQAGIKTDEINLADIGWKGAYFTDLQEKKIGALFKLYPWEMIWKDPFGIHLTENKTGIIEPAWKMLLSNKAILAVLWEMYPGHPNLLPAFQDEDKLKSYLRQSGGQPDYVKKPLLSREGANVTIIENGQATTTTRGIYGEEGYVFQAYHPLPNFNGNRPVIGSWIANGFPDPAYQLPTHPRGGKACGISIREGGRVSDNTSHFIPHYMMAETPKGPQ